jgi:hypothetical protein
MARWLRAWLLCWKRNAAEEEKPSCSFCGRPQSEVKKLVGAGPTFVCDECVAVMTDLLASEDRAWAEERVQALRHQLADAAEQCAPN